MLHGLFRLSLLCAVILGIALPKSTAALVALGLSRAQIIVICTGEGLRTITLDANGNPVAEDETDGHLCLMVHAVDGGSAPDVTHPVALSRDVALTLPLTVTDATRLPLHDAAPRAPPLS
ncbi:hypothetical protein [Sagittula sp. SSi028]|uniref:hypothetical protein n=1 Tax=Sagittula sp. SSi028 TaxID=3400636 RepID=UPI003AF60164